MMVKILLNVCSTDSFGAGEKSIVPHDVNTTTYKADLRAEAG